MRGSTAGLTESLKGNSRTHYTFLSFLDTAFSALIVAPCVVGYWRGTWELMTYYVYSDDIVRSSLVSCLIGFSGHLVFSLSQNYFMDNFHPDQKRLVYYTVSRLYSVIFAFVCVNSWRGAWMLLDAYTEHEIGTVLATTFVSTIALGAMRTLRNISAPPFVIVTDIVKGYFEVPTMFRIPSKRETSLYILDCLFSVFIVGSLVVFAWRGAWVIMDLYLYPHDEVLSSIGSLILGYGITVAAFLLQPLMKWLCDRLPDMWRIAVADIFLIFSFIGTVNVWRGIWNCLNIYFLPETPELSCWITHSVCLLLLILLNCSNSVLVRGVYIDAEEKGGKCVVFPCYYLRIYFQQERVKKNNRKIVQLQTMSKHKQELDFIVTKCDSTICACNMTEANINHVASNSPLVIQNDGKLNHSEV